MPADPVEDAPKRTLDRLGILTDHEWRQVHKDLMEMAKLRRRAEAESRNYVIG